MIWILLRFILFAAAVFVCMFLAKALVRKVFSIDSEDQGSFSDDYVNPSHRRIDKKFKEYSIVVLFIILVVSIAYFEDSFYWLVLALFVSTSLRMLIRAAFEWKHSAYPKQAVLTLTEIVVLLATVMVVLRTDVLF